jgi:hypothetical protein
MKSGDECSNKTARARTSLKFLENHHHQITKSSHSINAKSGTASIQLLQHVQQVVG